MKLSFLRVCFFVSSLLLAKWRKKNIFPWRQIIKTIFNASILAPPLEHFTPLYLWHQHLFFHSNFYASMTLRDKKRWREQRKNSVVYQDLSFSSQSLRLSNTSSSSFLSRLRGSRYFSNGKTVFVPNFFHSTLLFYHFIKNSPPVDLHIFHCIKMNILEDDGRSLLKNIFSYKRKTHNEAFFVSSRMFSSLRTVKAIKVSQKQLNLLSQKKSRISCKQFCITFNPREGGELSLKKKGLIFNICERFYNMNKCDFYSNPMK